MKLRIRNGRATLRRVTPRADGPGGKVRVKNKETGKTTFVSPKTLEDHPERYETSKSKRDKKQERKDLARQEREKRNLEYEKQKAEKPEPTKTEKHKQDALRKKKVEKEERKQKLKSKVKQRQKKEKQKAQQTEQDRRKQLKEKGKQVLLQREREDKWKGIEKDHPELSPKEQEERKKTFLETGVDSGGRSTKAIKWWLQHHGISEDEKDQPPKDRKLDKKSIQDHFKYGPKPTKAGKCPEGLKSVRISGGKGTAFVICVDPGMYDVQDSGAKSKGKGKPPKVK
jgi:hypothetical protein